MPEEVALQLKNMHAFIEDLKKQVGDTKEDLRRIKTISSTGSGGRDSLNNLKLTDKKLTYDPFKLNIQYKSIDDDVVDKMLEKFVETHNVKVPINRVDHSSYLFGTKLIYA